MKKIKTDVLILGAGGAGLFGALHARQANPDLSITLAVKGMLGKTGCTRLSEGGINVALGKDDSVERHFMDSIEVGKWLPDQELAWTMVASAPARFKELEEFGCVFDRNPDGTMHQKQFAGHSFSRTVHRGDTTGFEISDRLVEQVRASGIDLLEEHRAVEFVRNKTGDALAGVLMLGIKTGEVIFVQAQAVLLCTGGGPTMYKYFSPSPDKTCDGMAMALRIGLPLRDMEMIQFHPTGLFPERGERMTPILVEEALRNAGAHLVNGANERFMLNYDAKGELATRDIVSRAIFSEMRAGRTSARGGVFLSVQHLGAAYVRENFKYMNRVCGEHGGDLASGKVEVVPTAHFLMGGVAFNADCTTGLSGLFVAGEDAGGVHGANRLSGNGVADGAVFGGIFGDTIGAWIKNNAGFHEPNVDELRTAETSSRVPLTQSGGDLAAIRTALSELMWNDVGILRDAKGLQHAQDELDGLEARLSKTGVKSKAKEGNAGWHAWLDLNNQILVSKAICAAALAREDSRGGHFRTDFHDIRDVEHSRYTYVTATGGRLNTITKPVVFSRVKPGESLLKA